MADHVHMYIASAIAAMLEPNDRYDVSFAHAGDHTSTVTLDFRGVDSIPGRAHIEIEITQNLRDPQGGTS